MTVKVRKGIDDGHLTYLEAGHAAEGEGVASIALHARTAAEFYSGKADWTAIAKLKAGRHGHPVLGNGDVWSAVDALRMIARPDAMASWSGGVASADRGCSGSWPRRSTVSRQARQPKRRPSRLWVRWRVPSSASAELLVEFFDDENRA